MMFRREFLATLTALAGISATEAFAGFTEEGAFSEADLLTKAKALSEKPYAPRPKVPQPWVDLTYDQYRGIRFDPDKSIWKGSDSPLHVDLFPTGVYFAQAVDVHLVEAGKSRLITFQPDYFLYDEVVPELPDDVSVGFSGFRLRTELEEQGKFQEFFVMQGASYFRSYAPGQVYGLSARGLALNTAEPEGEEFPDFTGFWILRPEPGATSFRVYAMMDSPSLSGLYRFDIAHGTDVTMDVQAHLFPRQELEKVGIAPLTSMFFLDETNRDRFSDFRPAVHDSDGLLIHNGAGESLWRALANPKLLQISAFVDNNPRGFGLMQRAQDLRDFADLEARYDLRPGLWITPQDDWGKGAVLLVEIPTDREIYDNIVAFWRPEAPIEAGSEPVLNYRLTWGAAPEGPRDLAPVLNTRMGEKHDSEDDTRYVVTIDFGPHAALPDDPDLLEWEIRTSAGKTSPGILQFNPATNGLRLAFLFEPGDAELIEMRAQLKRDGQNVSESWLYRWTA